jgi:hypothetical protein
VRVPTPNAVLIALRFVVKVLRPVPMLFDVLDDRLA